MKERSITTINPQAKCPFCKALNDWTAIKYCKHSTGHEINLTNGKHTFFFVKNK